MQINTSNSTLSLILVLSFVGAVSAADSVIIYGEDVAIGSNALAAETYMGSGSWKNDPLANQGWGSDHAK
jgi:hypothetical protein